EHRLYPFASLKTGRHVLDIELEELDVVLYVLEVRVLPAGEVIENPDGFLSEKKGTHEDRANKPAAPGNKDYQGRLLMPGSAFDAKGSMVTATGPSVKEK